MKLTPLLIHAPLYEILLAALAHAQSLRVANAVDLQTTDPRATALQYHRQLVFGIYDVLLDRSAQFKPAPALAASWQIISLASWRFRPAKC